jgi:arabinogalactan endo-1,4-beta-galactosidase
MSERKLFVLFRLEELFAAAVERGEVGHIRDVIVVDEAHIYTDKDPDNILNTISTEARKFGVALICASQSPTHFTEDLLTSIATKINLGIDELFWPKAATSMRVTPEALAWVKPRQSMLVQMKQSGDTRNTWRWVVTKS